MNDSLIKTRQQICVPRAARNLRCCYDKDQVGSFMPPGILVRRDIMSRLHLRTPWFLLSLALCCCLTLFLCSYGRDATPTDQVSSPTPALFTYRRNDAAPVTQIRINARHRGNAIIQQDLFGNFLEHLGGAVYGGVWADALINPNLEKVADRDMEPEAWDLKGSATWQEGGFLSPRCVRLGEPDGSLGQRVFLPVHRTRRYSVTFYARAPAGPGQITFALQGMDARAGQIFAQTSLSIGRGDWSRQAFHWKLPVEAPAKGDAETLVIRYSGSGAVDVDEVTLFPEDAVDGLDPDVIRAARAWHIPILRLAGNFSSGQDWRDGVGPRERRPTIRNPAWGGVESNEFGTDEFLEFAHLIGAVAQIGANAGNGTPEEAADWVRYCNSRKMRVPIWEIGNELYGGWQIGHTDAAGNAARFLTFREAMRKADPRIKIIATGKGDEVLPDRVTRDLSWNDAVLRAALSGGGPAPDYLSLHPLVPLPGGLGNMSYQERYESAMAHPAFLDQTLLPALIQQVREIEGPDAPTRLAPTEWGIIVGGDRWREGPNHNVEAGAIFNALTLNTFLRHADWVTLANMTGLMHGGGIKKPNGIVIVDPQYYTQQLYAVAEPRLPVETDWEGPGQDVPQRGFLPAVQDVPDVDVFSALSRDTNRLTAFLVNRRLSDTRVVQLHLDGFAVGRASATLLTAPDPQVGNTWEHPDNVAPHPYPLSQNHMQDDWNLTLPAHSLVVLTFARVR